MSQFGMQMQGGRASRGAGMDVFTVLAFIGVVAMIAASVVMFTAAKSVGKGGSPIGIQEPGNVQLSQGGP